MILFLKNELQKQKSGAWGPRTLGHPWALQHGNPALGNKLAFNIHSEAPSHRMPQ